MKHPEVNVVIFFELLFLLVVQALQTHNPFYIFAHMVNTREAIDWAVSQGANAIESDLPFDENGNITIIEHGDEDVCDCWCAVLSDHICIEVLHRKCAGFGANDVAAAHMQYVATYNSITLYYIDSKVKTEWGDRLDKAGAAVVSFLDNNLFDYGYKRKVIISAAKIDRYNYIQAAVIAANNSVNKDRYFFTFDEEGDDYDGVMAMLSRLTSNRVYSTGISACLSIIYESGVDAGIIGKIVGENGMTIIWTIDLKSEMKKLINLGVQGLLTNRVGVAREVSLLFLSRLLMCLLQLIVIAIIIIMVV
jgi:glycerophosphoryl diester phosphodiesterase